MTKALEAARKQLRYALHICDKDGSNLVSVPLSTAEIRALLEEVEKCPAAR